MSQANQIDQEITKNDKKVLNAWAMYDWANSVYSLTITSAVFPAYYEAVTHSETTDQVEVFGYSFANTAIYSYALSLSFLIVVMISPVLSGIADYSGSKKSFMKFFAYLGAFSCSMLYFFEGPNLEFGLFFVVLASIGFSGSIVFYNAYLPEIATPDKHDELSARGYAFGYIGSVLLLIFNLAMILKPDLFGITEDGMAARISFLSVGIWWFLFSQITFARLPSNIYKRNPSGNILTKGFNELKKVWKELHKVEMKKIRFYLLAFFFYSMGVQTVMYMATAFGSKELQLPTDQLIICIIIIQLVAIGGAYGFARLTKGFGNIPVIISIVSMWILICVGAYFVKDAMGFFILAFFVGTVMGGIQSISRSTYSIMLPDTKDHASYFSFYDVVEKMSIVIGTGSYGFIEDFTGSMRNSVFGLLIFFIIALIILLSIRRLFKLQ